MEIVLFAVLLIKHYIVEYPVQLKFPFFVGKIASDWKFAKPLSVYAGLQAGLTTLICTLFLMRTKVEVSLVLTIFVFDFLIHFFLERIRVAPKYWGKYTVASPREFASLKNVTLLNRKQRRATKLSKDAGLNRAEMTIRNNKMFWNCKGLVDLVFNLGYVLIVLVITTSRVRL